MNRTLIFFKAHSLLKSDMRQEVEACDGELEMKSETEGAQWEVVERLGAGSRQRRGQGRIHGPGSTTVHSINPYGHQGENLICLQHMQALIYKCLQPLRNKKKVI